MDIEMDNDDRMDDFEVMVDPSGDFFGDHEDYSAEELEDSDGSKENDENDDSEDGEPEDIDEPFLEPERLPNPALTSSEPSDNDVEESGSATHRANRLRGGAEVELKNKPYIVKFKKGKAGAVYTNHRCVDENTAYTSQVGNQDNLFSPFSSKIEWEIAYWTKTRGPSSTAFTELMSIEGVCGITIITSG